MKNLLTLFFILSSCAAFAKPLTFVTYHATSQYYPNMSASEIAAIVPYGGKLKLKVEPDVDSTRAKKKLKAGNLLSEGDVQFGGTEETKGSLELKNVSGTAKSLETVDAYVQDIYLYNIQFPNPNGNMEWKELSLKTTGADYTAVFLTLKNKQNIVCKVTKTEQACTGRLTQDIRTFDSAIGDYIISYKFTPDANCPGDSWNDIYHSNPPYASDIEKVFYDAYLDEENIEAEVFATGIEGTMAKKDNWLDCTDSIPTCDRKHYGDNATNCENGGKSPMLGDWLDQEKQNICKNVATSGWTSGQNGQIYGRTKCQLLYEEIGYSGEQIFEYKKIDCSVPSLKVKYYYDVIECKYQ